MFCQFAQHWLRGMRLRKGYMLKVFVLLCLTSWFTAWLNYSQFERNGEVYVMKRRRFGIYVTFVPGGLGNRMFVYASALATSLRHNKSLAIILHDEESKTGYEVMRTLFHLTLWPKKLALPPFVEVLDEPGWGRYDSHMDNSAFFNGSVTLYGYRQSWKYFDACSRRIRMEFKLNEAYATTASNFLSSAAGNSHKSLFIGVHIRRGDMLDNPDLYTTAPKSYVLNAMDYYETIYGETYNLMYVIATNDQSWAEDVMNLRPDLKLHNVVYTGFNASVDLAILTMCNHSIITVGTFGWWAAWLAGGNVTYYKDFISSTSHLYLDYRSEDYYPPAWIGLA